MRDRELEVSPESQGCDCTEAGDLLLLTLVRVKPLISVLELHHVFFGFEGLYFVCVILVNRVLKLLKKFVVPRELGLLAGFKEFNQALVSVIPNFGCCSLLTDLASKLFPLGLETIPGGHYKSWFMVMW